MATDTARPWGNPAATDEGYGYNWTGLYTGAFAGSLHSIWDIDFNRNANHGAASLSSDGFGAGLYAGYNWQLWPRTVIGIEGDFGWSNASQDNPVFDNDTSYSELTSFGSLRARAGYTFGRLLLFATAGVAFANISQNIQKGQNAGEELLWEDERPFGYVVGGGVDYAFDRNWIGRLEYLYADYGTVTLYNRDGNGADFSNDMSIVRAGLAYRF